MDAFLGTAPARCVLLVGGPGSGKGLLCSRLVATCGVAHMSTGNMLREEVEAGTPLGHSVAEIMQAGKLVPSATITTLSTLLARAVLLSAVRVLLAPLADCGRGEVQESVIKTNESQGSLHG